MTNAWQYNLLKLTSRLVCLLPYSWLLSLGKILGRLYFCLAGRQRRRAIAQIQERLNLSPTAAEETIRRLFVNLGQTFLEVMYMPALTKEALARYVIFENRHFLDEAMACGKGVIFLTAHMGNWEWFGAALASAGYPVADIVKPQPNDQHTRILNEYRQMFGIEIFSRGTSEVVGAAKALKKGKILGFFVDQDAGVDGVFVNFLGKMASTPLGPAVFARKFDAPVVPGFISRQPDGRHIIRLAPPIFFPKSDDVESDRYRMTLAMTAIVEQAIRTWPDEWLWFQKRWNTKYEGKPGDPGAGDPE
ncbi:MAG TPA: lysophospholipid acyltransferase family protein [Patescibacteria group bacterium]|nr:lysophospholipid acyltransferase family protein [Patescibacteria group bacterium]